jgi:lipopolysaccharide cholinephosphotransferase
MEFEGMEVMAPSGYEHLLRVWFGDYTQFPPMEKRGVWHAGTVFDADIPYKDYLRNQGIEL